MHRHAFAVSLTGVLAAAGAGAETTVSHGISAFGPLKYSADFTHFDYVDPAAPRGGELSFRGTGASRTFDSLNLFILAGEPAQGLELLHDTLMVRAFDEPDAVYGQLAESVEYPADRSFAIFTLREGARFSDGEPVTAADVVFTLRTLQEDGAPNWRLRLDDVTEVDALDDRRVRVAFDPTVATRDLISQVGLIPILPEHYYAEVPFEQSTLEPPVSSGGYRVADVEPGRSITYCRDPDYWGAGLPVNIGQYNFDCVVYEYFLDNNAAFEALKVGAYLFHEEFTSAIWATGYDFPAVENGWVVRETIPDERPSGAQGFWFNLRRDKLADARTREAIARMFNFEWSNETLFYGLYTRTDSFFENSPMQAEGRVDGAERALLEEFRADLPPEIFSEPAFVPEVSSTRKIDRAAVREASALLDAAGWEVGADGTRRNADGVPLTLDFVHSSPGFDRIVLPFIENLQRVGIDARNIRIDPAQYRQRLQEFDYDITIGRFIMSLSPSVELRTIFGSDAADAPGSYNYSGIADPVVDALIAEIIAAGSRDEMQTAVRALDRVLRDRHIWVPNWYKASHNLAYWDVFGRPDTKPAYSRGDETWWFDRAKYEALRAEGALR